MRTAVERLLARPSGRAALGLLGVGLAVLLGGVWLGPLVGVLMLVPLEIQGRAIRRELVGDASRVRRRVRRLVATR
jgi:hypothetical protein